MEVYRLRPSLWAEEFALLTLRLKPGDVVRVMEPEERQAIQEYAAEQGLGIIVEEMEWSGQCKNCGVDTYDNFCPTCARGGLHKQSCPQLINRDGSRNTFRTLAAVRAIDVNPAEQPCNCGALELEAALKHAENGMRL